MASVRAQADFGEVDVLLRGVVQRCIISCLISRIRTSVWCS